MGDAVERFRARQLERAIAAGKTPEDAQREQDEMLRRAAERLKQVALGICGVCGEQSADWRQDGKCIYSVPCGHRVGQGDAARFKKGVLEARRMLAASKAGQRADGGD